MPLYNAESFLGAVRNARTLHVDGRYGGGKTSLAAHIAWIFLKRGWVKNVCANFPMSIAQFPPPLPLQDTAVVLDEASEFVSQWSKASKYVKDLRKMNTIYLMPSVFPPHARLRRLTAQRLINLYVYGIPAWVYSWQFSVGSVRDGSKFIWWKPIRDIKGLYQTGYSANTDWGIEAAAMQSHKRQATDDDTTREDIDQQDEIVTSLQDAAESMDNTASAFGRAIRRLSR